MAGYSRLSPQDASFLYAETPTTHMHVGALTIFEDPGLTQEELNAHIDRRLNQVPRFRQKLKWVPYDLGRPVWVDDPNFDVRFHVRHAGLPRPAGPRELRTLMGRLMSIQLDRGRPLWELWIVDLPRRRKAIIQKTHHALIDGISGIDLATVLLDFSPAAPESAPERWHPADPPSTLALASKTILHGFRRPLETLDALRRAPLAPEKLIGRALELGRGLINFGKAGLDVAPHTSLSTPIGAHRRFETVRAKLSDIKRVKNHYGCTVNDVVLALVTRGLRHFFLQRDEPVVGLTLRAAVPVSVRDASERMTYGNRVAVMFADLPVGEEDAERCLARVRQQMSRVKESGEAVAAEVLMKMADFTPPTILSLAAQAIVANQWLINLTITNVPGPQQPLYLRGGKMLEAYPYVPLLKNTAVGVAILSYDGQLNFGLSGDWDAVPDLALLAEGIEMELKAYLRRCRKRR
jgi:WS/DGAT/MGAT family acyltransferase